jgi:hypothetical protein
MSETEPDHEHSTSAWEQRVRADLRRMVASTRPETRARLELLAKEAARTPGRAPRTTGWRIAWPLAVCTVAASLLIVFWRPNTAATDPRARAPDDLALLLNVDNLDLLEQMEFYQWLDREPALLESDAKPEAQRS